MNRNDPGIYEVVKADALTAMRYQKTLRGKWLYLKIAYQAQRRINELKRQ